LVFDCGLGVVCNGFIVCFVEGGWVVEFKVYLWVVINVGIFFGVLFGGFVFVVD